MNTYLLSVSAISDLEEISDYTYDEWGHQAQKKYLYAFEETFEKIGAGKIPKRLFSKEFPRLLSAKSGRHFVFISKTVRTESLRSLQFFMKESILPIVWNTDWSKSEYPRIECERKIKSHI